ncbi:MAG: glycosyltransferase family 9 protein [Bacteroidota bacterium]|jgi:heptosyltransferase-2|nr:glycosyltransferase family 9 protein [Cytophagales bacterium]MCE2956978.1 glycosyltransferase family 9 protein [Flammeovirgaceae bacterium]MCZ8072283.1 glycosyltransferase family 9 protein [Cytophagales bacterium]
MRPKSFLIIQTAFIGDVILATALIEKLHAFFPDAHIDFLLRKGNEGLLVNHPYLREVIVFDKKNKYSNLWKLLKKIRSTRYDVLINAQRFATTGIVTAFANATETVGFDKNPFSFLFSRRIKHQVGALHEIDRNQKLIEHLTDSKSAKPRLYPSLEHQERVRPLMVGNYYCLAPTSVWFTKQWPAEKWIELIPLTSSKADVIYLLGAPTDHHVCESIRLTVSSNKVVNLAGKLSFLESAALMQRAAMNFVNDSAPMHLASAMNAPVTAIFCSTVPSFGFGPLSDQSNIIETQEKLSCRPCGLHGYKDCPKGHFQCAYSIDVVRVADAIK